MPKPRRHLGRPSVLYLALILSFLSTVSAVAAAPWANVADPVFVRIDGRELPDSDVYSLAQDAAGFVWVGTAGGLGRYDGRHFKAFLPKPADRKALPDGYIFAMLADANGLWLGTGSNGLVRFDSRTETFRTWRLDPSGNHGPTSADVTALARTSDGRIWIGGGGGASSFNPQSGTFERVILGPTQRQPAVRSILVDGAGAIWMGSADGLFVRAAGQTRFRRVQLLSRNVKTPIWALYEDRRGNLWVGSENALFVLDRRRQLATKYVSVPSDPASLASGSQFAVIEARGGVVWAGSSEGTLSIVDVATHRVQRVQPDPKSPNSLTRGRLQQFLQDRSGLIWVANFSGGLLLHNPLTRGLYLVSATRVGSDIGDVYSLAADGDRVWFGGPNGSLGALDPQKARIARVEVPNRSLVFSIYPRADGDLWIGTSRGLCQSVAASPARCPAGPSEIGTASVYDMAEAGGAFWVGTRSGLFYQQNGSVGTIVHDLLRTLYADGDGTLWAGTANGLERVDPRSHRVTRFAYDPNNPVSIGPGVVDAILKDRRGRIWAGTYGGPLNVMQRRTGGVHFTHLDETDGLPHENVDGLAEDPQGRIWASTDRGIALIDPDSLRARALGPIDGLSNMDYHANVSSKSRDGTIFFGGPEGVVVITPGAASPWDYAPPIVVTAVTAGGRALPVSDLNAGQSVQLPANERDVSIEFAALDYSAPESLKYAYMLDGYNRDWIDADAAHRVAVYTNLSPGNYTLRVRATNRLGVWSTHALALSIVALPAWYETWAFRILAVLALVAALAFIYRARTQTLQNRSRDLEALVQMRTLELGAANVALQEMSLTDPLTGLRNRRFLLQYIDAEIALSLRQGSDLLFFMIDIDRFKSVNDEFGHAAGDQVIAQMRERLQEVFRESDYLLRWGGEEFLAIARAANRDEASEIAERVRIAVASRPFVLDDGQVLAKTASIGFAAFPFMPADPGAVSWAQVAEIADRALYMAKRNGRNVWYGLTATSQTNAVVLASRLAAGSTDLVRAAALHVVNGSPVSPG